jgi:hypothetical protein
VETVIPLKLLFIFPADRNSPLPEASIDYFWKGGIKNLDEEMEACEALFSSQERAGEVDTGVPMSSMTA